MLLACSGGGGNDGDAPNAAEGIRSTPTLASSGGDSDDLKDRVNEAFRLYNDADWETAYESLLTRAQKLTCSLDEFVEYQDQNLSLIRETGARGEQEPINLRVEIEGGAGKAFYTVLLDGVPVLNYTIANPDVWLWEDGAWRNVDQSDSGPCNNQDDPLLDESFSPGLIPNLSLLTTIRFALDKFTGVITPADMSNLVELFADSADITDLSGLEYAVNMTRLSLEGKQISDISQVAGLTGLTSLSLKGNQVSDVAPLAGLHSLTELNLTGQPGQRHIAPVGTHWPYGTAAERQRDQRHIAPVGTHRPYEPEPARQPGQRRCASGGPPQPDGTQTDQQRDQRLVAPVGPRGSYMVGNRR